MIQIEQKYKAHPIGQGFFYSGQLKSIGSSAKFNFIFDCGSLSYSVLNNTIDRFRNRDANDTKDLDLLIISHFDADHINGLKRLLNGRKVKQIIAPFIGFKQRITIALNYINSLEDDLDNSLNSIIDITSVLKENIDENTKFILINETDEFPPEEEGNENTEILNENDNDFSFAFNNANDLSRSDKNELNFQNNSNIKKVDCDKIASILVGGIKILDLIFYRKKVGAKDLAFFDKVFELFINKNNFADKDNPTTQEIVDVIKKLRRAGKIKQLFEDAAKIIKIDLANKKINNLNTTALSMLHWDRIYSSLIRGNKSSRRFHLEGEIILSKIFGDKEIEFPIASNFHYHHFHNFDLLHSSNTLLTADSFLKDKSDIGAFIKHYKSYLDRIMMFQIPHHGSRNSSSKYLFSQLAPNYYFINYGVNHNFIKRWSHPHKEVIDNIVATGHSSKLIPVHEFSGYKIVQRIYIHKTKR